MKTEVAKLTEQETTETDTVDLSEFETNTQAWQDVSYENNGKLGNVILANTFNIPKDDILAMAVEILRLRDSASSVRAYIGITPYEEHPESSEMRLYFTGVNQDNLPILQDSDGDSAIYDFTMPCPPTC
ncbi:MAG: hypothetical protein AB8B56_19660 [Crocinitomicaceae bacterium]